MQKRKRMNRDAFFGKLKYQMSPNNIELIALAYRLAKYGHKDQKRDAGERYFEHLRRVAWILMDELYIYDHEMIITALLHDTNEDTFILTLKNIGTVFGERVMRMVELLSKEVNKEYEGFKIEKEKAPDYIGALEAADEATRIIKLADRLDNIRTLEGCKLEKIKRKLKETKKFYLPIAKKTNIYLYDNIKFHVERIEKLLSDKK